MIFFNAVFKLGASPDSSTITPPLPVVVNRSFSRVRSLLSEETLEPTVTNAAGIQPLYLLPVKTIHDVEMYALTSQAKLL